MNEYTGGALDTIELVMSEEMEKHAKIALWLGYVEYHTTDSARWHFSLADAMQNTNRIERPDFYNDPVHLERIKAKLQSLGYDYDLSYRQKQHTNWPNVYRLKYWGLHDSGILYGLSEGDVLIQCALAMIERGIK